MYPVPCPFCKETYPDSLSCEPDMESECISACFNTIVFHCYSSGHMTTSLHKPRTMKGVHSLT